MPWLQREIGKHQADLYNWCASENIGEGDTGSCWDLWESQRNKNMKGTVGFVKGLGFDVNIMRLWQRVYDLKFLRKKEDKYVFFIDLKAAYDSVKNKKLFEKMKKKGYNKILSKWFTRVLGWGWTLCRNI